MLEPWWWSVAELELAARQPLVQVLVQLAQVVAVLDSLALEPTRLLLWCWLYLLLGLQRVPRPRQELVH